MHGRVLKSIKKRNVPTNPKWQRFKQNHWLNKVKTMETTLIFIELEIDTKVQCAYIENKVYTIRFFNFSANFYPTFAIRSDANQTYF